MKIHRLSFSWTWTFTTTLSIYLENLKNKISFTTLFVQTSGKTYYYFPFWVEITIRCNSTLELYFALPNRVIPQQTVSYCLLLTNSGLYNPFKQWKAMGSPSQPSETQLKVLLESSNIEQSPVELYTPVKERLVLRNTLK